jgi:hypothetical protein
MSQTLTVFQRIGRADRIREELEEVFGINFSTNREGK